MSDDLITRLRAAIDETELRIAAAERGGDNWEQLPDDGQRMVAAHRKILDLCEQETNRSGENAEFDETTMTVEHPDYREERAA